MKIFFRSLIVFMSLVLIFISYSCKSKTETYTSDKGKMQVTSDGEKADITVETKEGKTFKMTVNKGTLPEGWPSDIPVISGGNIIFSQTEAKSNMKQISIESEKSLKDALDFYKNTLKSGGWSIENTINMPQMNMVNAKKDKQELMLQVAEAEGKTHIQIIIR